MSSLDGTLRVRPVQLGDQECIRILLSGFKLPLEGLENAKMWVLTDINGNIFGTAGLEIYGHKGLLRSVAVRKNLSNSGYGTYLVNHVIGEARKSGVHELFLLTTTAPVFFRKLGFKEDDHKRVAGSITNSAEFKSACPRTAILMRFSLR